MPANTPEAVIRPIANLPDARLQVAAWRCVTAVSPSARGPTTSLASRVVRAVRNAISDAQPGGKGPWQAKRKYPASELPFLRPLQKLSTWGGFDAGLVVSHLKDPGRAVRIYQAAAITIKRCEDLQKALIAQFPGTL